MVNIKQKDFVDMEYTGKLKENDAVFDTTDEKTAKDEGIHNPNMTYGSVGICIGENQLLEGLDEQVVGKEIGKSYTIDIPPEKAFGKKNPKYLKIINTAVFTKQNIKPEPGLQVNIDGAIGMIKTVTGGRTVVDLNHPLSGKDLVYDVKLNKLITDDKEKLSAYLTLSMNLRKDSFEITLDGKKAKVLFKPGINLKRFDMDKLNKKVIELIGLENVVYEEGDAPQEKKEEISTPK